VRSLTIVSFIHIHRIHRAISLHTLPCEQETFGNDLRPANPPRSVEQQTQPRRTKGASNQPVSINMTRGRVRALLLCCVVAAAAVPGASARFALPYRRDEAIANPPVECLSKHLRKSINWGVATAAYQVSRQVAAGGRLAG
jgi:hypothetical protein